MPLISVDAKCVICGKDMRREAQKSAISHYSAELSQLIFCDECRARLKRVLYQELLPGEEEDFFDVKETEGDG